MILIAPVKTEKAIRKIEEENTLTFRVDGRATKDAVKAEVERLFSVKVQDVRTNLSSRGRKVAHVKLRKEFKADDVAVKLKMIA